MVSPDVIPVWLGVPAAVVFSVWWVVLEFRAARVDPLDELTGLDVLERTGVHPHG